MCKRNGGMILALAVGLAALGWATTAHAQDGGYAPPPPPPPAPTPYATDLPPGPPPPSYRPAPRPRRFRYRPGRFGRFYVGTGLGYMWPGGQLGERIEPGLAWGLWTGWRKRWLGFELGYLGSRPEPGPAPVLYNDGGNTDVPSASYVTVAPETGKLTHVTGDVKMFFRLFCKATLFGRLGINYTHLSQAFGPKHSGYGYQVGGGIDYRIRLSWRPDLIIKLRAEVVSIHATLTDAEEIDERSFSGLYTMFYLNLGWAPR